MEECANQSVAYIPVGNNIESVTAKRTRRHVMRRQFKRQPTSPKPQQQKRNNKASAKRRRMVCKSSRCQCYDRPPPKDKFEVAGEREVVYASSTTYFSKYIGVSDELGNERCYWGRHKTIVDKHIFSLHLSKQQTCLVNDILADGVYIHINGIEVSWIWDCLFARAKIDKQCILIEHYFNPQHDTTPWAWEEAFYLDVVSPSLPSKIIDEAEQIIESFKHRKNWDGHQLHELLQKKGFSSVRFNSIEFEELSMQYGKSETYHAAVREIRDRNMTKKYGYNWRETWKQIETEKKRKELQEKKLKYWRCPNGYKFCHDIGINRLYHGLRSRCPECKTLDVKRAIEHDRKQYWRCVWGWRNCHSGTSMWGRDWRCSKECSFLHGKYPNKSKEEYSHCFNGYELCHKGVLCCPGCKNENTKHWKTTYISSPDKIVYAKQSVVMK